MNYNYPTNKQLVICEPDIIEFILNEDCKYIIIACDGIWDCINNTDIIKIFNKYENNNLCSTIEEFFDSIITKNRTDDIGSDNMSMIIVKLYNKNNFKNINFT